MNALRLDPSEYALARLLEPHREPLFSRKTAIAVGSVLLCYGALGFYLATMKSAPIPFEPPVEAGPIVVQPWRETPQKPVVQPDKPTVRAPAAPPITPPPTTLPFTPSTEPPAVAMPTDFSTATAPSIASTAGATEPSEEAASTPPAAPSVIRNPVWISRPTAEQVGRLYPVRAAERGLSGQAILLCVIRPNGSVTGCEVTSETPAGWRFGDAALSMARYFRISPKTIDGQIVEGSRVQIPVTFSLPD